MEGLEALQYKGLQTKIPQMTNYTACHKKTYCGQNTSLIETF